MRKRETGQEKSITGKSIFCMEGDRALPLQMKYFTKNLYLHSDPIRASCVYVW